MFFSHLWMLLIIVEKIHKTRILGKYDNKSEIRFKNTLASASLKLHGKTTTVECPLKTGIEIAFIFIKLF